MRISYLRLTNYRRFRDVEVQFPDGVVGIIGPNGSGKTTLIEGVAWALFGNTEEVVRTTRESIRRAGSRASEACGAILEFELGGSHYRIEREMGGKSMSMKASLRTGDTVIAEGDRAVREAVEKRIGMDHKSFFTSVFARQKELNALQNVAAGERKKAVLRMLRIDGVDDIIQRVREDRRGFDKRIEGAEGTLLDENGRDRETMIKASIPGLRSALEEAETLLKAAEGAEKAAKKEFEEARAKRDLLKKDFDAYNAAAKDLHGKRSLRTGHEKSSESIEKRVKESQAQLARLPELEASEREWAETAALLKSLDAERRKDDKAKHLEKDLKSDRAGRESRAKDLVEAERAAAGADELETQRKAAERSREESERTRTSISDKMGELRSMRKEREESAAKDRAKLDEIQRLGKDGTCPTCERRLDEAYGLLVAKLRKDVDEAEAAAGRAAAEAEALLAELKSLDKKDEAIKKKMARIELESGMRGKAEATAQSLKGQLAELDARIASKSKELESLGEIKFSEEEDKRTRAKKDKLEPIHEDYLRIKGTEKTLAQARAEKAELQDTLDKLGLEIEALSRLTADLEPKKELYEKTQKVLDDKTNIMNDAKDQARSRANKRDSAKNSLQSGEKELENIEKVKRDIESDRSRRDELASLEDVMLSFKDHLIGRVAPTLAELTSHVLESATAGRYSRVELDDSYEIQVDDEGTLHRLGRFSGGEADLANLALRLAISRIIAERTGANPINFLILDEIFGSLDPERKRSVMTALGGLSAQFRQILLITHIEDIKDLMGYVIRVERTEDGTSIVALEQ